MAQEHMVYARDLSIAWSNNNQYWSWLPLRETHIEAAVLKAVCWLAIDGTFHTIVLKPKTMYEVVYVVKLEETASGWEIPVNLKLTLPNSTQERNVTLKEHIGQWWVDILAGEFMTSRENAGEISFSMSETKSNQWKKGLIVKGVAIRPKPRACNKY